MDNWDALAERAAQEMTQKTAQIAYEKEWAILNKEFEVLKLAGDKRTIKECRQRLNALSIEHNDRFIIPMEID